jgi:hypothetical protein
VMGAAAARLDRNYQGALINEELLRRLNRFYFCSWVGSSHGLSSYGGTSDSWV